MSDDFIPSNDDKFDDLQEHFVEKVTTDPVKYNQTKEQIAALAVSQTLWTAAFGEHKQAQLKARQKALEKDESRESLTKLIRSSVRTINGIPTITNADRTELGLLPHAETRAKAPVPSTRPVLRVVDKGARRHEVHWVDADTPHSRAKPRGVDACELFVKIGDPAPTSEKECIYVARDTASPYLYEFDVADVGKTVHWLGRWVNRANDHGPAGATVSAKVNP